MQLSQSIKDNWKKHARFLAMAYAIVLAVNITNNWQYYVNGGDWHFSIIFVIVMTTMCWLFYVLLNELLVTKILDRIGWDYWKENPFMMILFIIGISVVFGIGIMVGAMKGASFYYKWSPSLQDYIANCSFAVLFSLIFGLIGYGLEFIKQWKTADDNNTLMREEMARSQYELLKTQVNPHFLFNSLNTLTSLIPQDPAIAVSFVQQLSRVFRYSLSHSSDSTIPLGMELKVVESYLFLNKQRYGDKLIIEINADEYLLQRHIITQALLMLAENAIKHNEISVQHPLTLRIATENTMLVVTNTLQPRKLLEPSTGIGLKNIINRYQIITPVPVTVSTENNWFTVKLPLL